MKVEVNDFLSEDRKKILFENAYDSLRHLIPNFISMHVIPVLSEYRTHIETNPETEALSAEKFLDAHLYQEAFIDFKCYWKMIDLMEELVKL